MKELTFGTAVDGYLIFAESRKSPHTIADYSNTFRKFVSFSGADTLIKAIKPSDIDLFLLEQDEVCQKTKLNYHTGLSALWDWMKSQHLVTENLMRSVEAPRPEHREMHPFTDQDVKLIMASIHSTKPYNFKGHSDVKRSLPEEKRTRAMLLIMFDTGLRVSELCDLKIKDCDLRNRQIRAFGKGSKERYIPFSPVTGQAIWIYLNTREATNVNLSLLATEFGRKLDRHNIRHICERIGDRAGVMNCHPHIFRHTFAITYLRNGGDIFTLQKILGHSTLDMVKRYLSIAMTDVAAAHRNASPVMNWGL